MLKVANSVINASQITGVLPVVNGGTGVTTSTGTGNTVLSAAPTLSGNVTLSTGNLVIGTAGKGIDFSADPSAAGMTSELLADYEEGTWTPNQGAGLTVVGAFSSSGRYTKIGRLVSVTGVVEGATSVAASSIGIICSNLPFIVQTNLSGILPGITMPNTVATSGCCWGNGDTTNLYAAEAVSATIKIWFSITYSA